MLNRRAFVLGSTAVPVAACAAAQEKVGQPPNVTAQRPPRSYGPMVATLTVPAQPGVSSGTFAFSESTGSRLDQWLDPRDKFALSLTQVTNSAFPGFRVIFVRSRDGKWASVEFWLGDSSVAPRHMSQGYSVVVTGDFTASSATPYHWWGARWRLSGSPDDGLRPGRNDWPYPLTDYQTLVGEHLIPRFDPGQTTVAMRPHNYNLPYTPMTNCGITMGMPNGGGRPDIGLFTEWSCYYFLTQANGQWEGQAAAALGCLQAYNEAGASIPWFVYDPARGCMWERLVNHAGATAIASAPPLFAYMPLLASGPPGAKLCGTVRDSAAKTIWYLPGNSTIPASGRVTVTTHYPSLYHPPTGEPVPVGTGAALGDPGVTYAWGDPSQFIPATPWFVNADHQPELGYLSYLLFRDPWDLHTIQADAMWSANVHPGMIGGTVRQQAWDYAHAVQACAATPENTPPWLVPRSTLEKWVNVVQHFFSTHFLDHCDPSHPEGAGLAATFHTAAWFLGGPAAKAPDGTLLTPAATMFNPWQDAYFCQAASLGAMLRPSDTTAQRLVAYIAQGIGDRYGGKLGWPAGAETVIAFRGRDTGTSPVYASLSDAWAGGKKLWWLLHDLKLPDPIPPDPETLSISRDRANYVTGDFGALSLAVQAGLTQYRPQRDWLGAACRQLGVVPFNRAFAQV